MICNVFYVSFLVKYYHRGFVPFNWVLLLLLLLFGAGAFVVVVLSLKPDINFR